MRHLLSIEDLDRAAIERILDRAKTFTEVSEREIKKVPALRGRRVLNLFYEASTRTRSSFELAAKSLSRRRHQLRRVRLVRRQGRVAQGHRADDVRLPPGPDRHPHAARRRRRAGRRLDDRERRQRGRRQARAPDAGAAGRLHAARAARQPRRPEHLDRRRRPHSRVARSSILAFHEDGREGHRLRPADADPARDGALVRRRATTSTASRRPTSSTRCACRTSA